MESPVCRLSEGFLFKKICHQLCRVTLELLSDNYVFFLLCICCSAIFRTSFPVLPYSKYLLDGLQIFSSYGSRPRLQPCMDNTFTMQYLSVEHSTACSSPSLFAMTPSHTTDLMSACINFVHFYFTIF